MSSAPEHRLLTAQEVADQFRVSVSTISRWAKDGVLHPVRVGGVLRFRRDELETLLAPATPEPKGVVA